MEEEETTWRTILEMCVVRLFCDHGAHRWSLGDEVSLGTFRRPGPSLSERVPSTIERTLRGIRAAMLLHGHGLEARMLFARAQQSEGTPVAMNGRPLRGCARTLSPLPRFHDRTCGTVDMGSFKKTNPPMFRKYTGQHESQAVIVVGGVYQCDPSAALCGGCMSHPVNVTSSLVFFSHVHVISVVLFV